MHEVCDASLREELLGWDFDGKGHVVRPSSRRLWKVRLAIRSVLKSKTVSGRELEKLVGHIIFISLINRSSLACMNAVYSCIL